MKWNLASKQKPKVGNVLVMYLEPSWGSLMPQVTVAYYDGDDASEDYRGGGWIQDPSGKPLLHVTHWATLPSLPVGYKHGIFTKKLSQGSLIEDQHSTVDLEQSLVHKNNKIS